jgi:hypothetical protein
MFSHLADRPLSAWIIMPDREVAERAIRTDGLRNPRDHRAARARPGLRRDARLRRRETDARLRHREALHDAVLLAYG